MACLFDDVLDRRSFLKGVGTGLLMLTGAERNLQGLMRPLTRSRVALIRTSDRRDGVTRAMALLNPRGISGRHVVVKPNFNTADAAPAGTDNETLAQLVAELRERDCRSITLGESSGPPDTGEVMSLKGIPDMASDLGFSVINYDTIAESDWIHFRPRGTHWQEGFYLPRHVVDAEYNVSTCCLKTHAYGGVFTMSLKLSVGLTPKPIRRGMHRSPDMRKMIAELNQGYRPDLIIMDGIKVFTDGGPSRGTTRDGNVMIAGTDRVAVDAVGLAILREIGSNSAIMGTPIFQQEQIARAVELGLGISSPDQIDLVSDSIDGEAYIDRLRPILGREQLAR